MESSAFPTTDLPTAPVPDQQHLIIGAAETPPLSPFVIASVKSKLPKYIILKSRANDLYLRYIDKPASYLAQLEFSGGNPLDKKSYKLSPKDKFEVVESAKSSNNYVHIKSCYNNKYWECLPETNHISATAIATLEDETSDACTLFQPMYVDEAAENKILRLLHVSSNKFVSAEPSGPHQYLLQVDIFSEDDDSPREVFTVIDWKTIVILPKRLVFKGQNGMYLKACTYSGYPYMAFQSKKNYEEFEANEINQRPDGTISIRNEYFDKFWWTNRDTGGWIYVSGNSDETPGVHFKPVALDTNTKIALQSLHNENFCTFSVNDKTSCLSATSPRIDENSHMTIEEAVVSRVIDNVKYRMLDARKIEENIEHADSDDIENTTDEPKTKFTKAITLADSNSSTWDYMASVKLEVSTTLKTGVPFIVDGEIEISAEIGKSYKWGGADKEDTEVGGKLTAKVPPKSKLTVNLTYTKGTCEVPFSYVQHDTLTNGVSETTEMEGGVYTGISCYSFKFETIQTAL